MPHRQNALYIIATWDDDAAVWVAQSTDVPGLCIEAPTQQELKARLKDVIPELLELNKREMPKVPVELLLRGQSHIEMAC